MDTDLESFIERPPTEAELRAEIRASAWRYVALTALISLLVGVAIGRFGHSPGANPTSAQSEPPPGWEQDCAPQTSAQDVEPTGTPAPLSVYVSGAVLEPQVITVPAGSLVADALDAAGGPAPHADLDAVNLAAPLANHQQVIIPGKTETIGAPTRDETAPETEPTSAATEIINLNTATAEELQTLPGIGASRAQDIVAYRKANGPFEHIEDIQQVSGIGEGIFAEIEPYITVGD